MSISDELETAILRYYFAEKWRINTIATQLGIHHSTVSRVLSQAGVPKAKRTRRPSILDDYTPMILETLEQFPTLSAARVYQMAVERGYTGSDSHFRHHVAELRPRPPAEAFLRLKTLAGEQAQVDWAHFHYLQIGRAKRPVMAFVMVLSWSRAIYLHFFLNQKTENFVRGHVQGFEYFGAAPRVVLYDNLKSAVLERQGNAIRFHPTLLALSAHYRFEPRPVGVRRGNEKGRVERAIRYIRDNFFAARQWRDLPDLNAQAEQWCRQIAGERRCPEAPDLSVNAAWAKEREQLLALPPNAFDCHERLEVRVGKTPYARFDLNDYSVPPQYVRRTLTVLASLQTVRLIDQDQVVASHPRTFGKHEQIEDPAHLSALIENKQAAQGHRAVDRLTKSVPQTPTFLELAASHCLPLGPLVAQLNALLNRYGAQELQLGVVEALEQQRPHAAAVLQCVERRREERQTPPPISVPLPEKLQGVSVRPATLSAYDSLSPKTVSRQTHPDSQPLSDTDNKPSGDDS